MTMDHPNSHASHSAWQHIWAGKQALAAGRRFWSTVTNQQLGYQTESLKRELGTSVHGVISYS